MAINFPSSPSLNDTHTDVTSGLTWTWNGSSWVSTPGDIELATDTTGDYVESLVAGTGVALADNSGEAATPTISIGQAVGTTDDVTFNTVTGTNGLITLTSSGVPSATPSDGALAIDTVNNILYIRSGGQWVQSSGGASVSVSDTAPSSPDSGDLWFESDTGITYVYYNDGTTSQWVEVGAAGLAVSGSDGYVQFANAGELSSSSSFVWDDTNSRLGINTATPSYELEVVGDIVATTVTGSSGVVTTTTSGEPTISIDDGAIAVDTSNDVLYFRSNGTWQQVSGGGASVTVSDATPSESEAGNLWYESDTGSMYIYYDDGVSQQWVEVGGSSVVAMTVSDAPPSTPTNGDLWFEADTGKTYVYYDDGSSSQWVEIGAAATVVSNGGDGAIQYSDSGTLGSSSDFVWNTVTNTLELTGDIAATGNFSVTGTISAAAGIITGTSDGEPTSSMNDGAIILDTTNNILYVRSNGEWVESSGGASVTVSDATPSDSELGDMWFESDTGKLLVYYNNTWVEVGGSGGSGSTETYSLTSSSSDAALFIMEIGP